MAGLCGAGLAVQERISRAANLLVLVTTDRFVPVWVSVYTVQLTIYYRREADKLRPAVFRDLLDKRPGPGGEAVRENSEQESSEKKSSVL